MKKNNNSSFSDTDLFLIRENLRYLNSFIFISNMAPSDIKGLMMVCLFNLIKKKKIIYLKNKNLIKISVFQKIQKLK